jgi:V/A-type H+-transporting ATPase subunit E
MGGEELIESLRKEASEKMREIREEAEKEAERMREDVSLRLEALQQDEAAGRSSGEEPARVLLDAQNRVRMIRLSSEDRLSGRLYSLAASSLHMLRAQGYGDIFHRLALELPSHVWRNVRVNPEDSGLAKKFFPDAEIIADSNVTGGMEVEAEGGGVRIINTLEKRVERAWPLMLPLLMDDIYRKVTGNGTAPGI